MQRSFIPILAIFAILLHLVLPVSAQWGNSFMTEKEKAEEKSRLEKERMEAREAAARERTEQLRREGQRGLAEIATRLDEANAWFKSVSELKRQQDTVFGTNSFPAEVVAEAVRIRKTLLQCEREVSWLRQEISGGSTRTTRSVMADIEKNQDVARRVCDEAEAFARNTFKTSAEILSRNATVLEDKFEEMADRTEFLEWNEDRGLGLCHGAQNKELHPEEIALLRVWETMHPYRELDPDRIGTYKPDDASVQTGRRSAYAGGSDDPWSGSDEYGGRGGTAWGTTGGLFDVLHAFADIRLKVESLWMDSADWDPKWKENKLARKAASESVDPSEEPDSSSSPEERRSSRGSRRVVGLSREFVNDHIKKNGNCRIVAITKTGGDIVVCGDNNWAASGCSRKITSELQKIADDGAIIVDVCLTELGGFLALHGRNGAVWNLIPKEMERHLRNLNSDDEQLYSATFNDAGDWIVVGSEHYACSATWLKQWLSDGGAKFGVLRAATVTADAAVAVYDNGFRFFGNVPDDLKCALKEAGFDVQIVKIAGSAWFFASRDGKKYRAKM